MHKALIKKVLDFQSMKTCYQQVLYPRNILTHFKYNIDVELKSYQEL